MGSTVARRARIHPATAPDAVIIGPRDRLEFATKRDWPAEHLYHASHRHELWIFPFAPEQMIRAFQRFRLLATRLPTNGLGLGIVLFVLALGTRSLAAASYQTYAIEGWTVLVDERLLTGEDSRTRQALELLRAQLKEIARVVPPPAVAKLREVRLWFSPEYAGFRPTAEYHPDAGWLRQNGRNEAMARSVEFTNVRTFEAEAKRMPNFALHELAHAYHHRVLPGGYENAPIAAAYNQAKGRGSYDQVERWLGNGRPNTRERAYAMTSPMEYFAESTEAFFARNDFFPFDRIELKRHDPDMERLVAKLWGVED